METTLAMLIEDSLIPLLAEHFDSMSEDDNDGGEAAVRAQTVFLQACCARVGTMTFAEDVELYPAVDSEIPEMLEPVIGSIRRAIASAETQEELVAAIERGIIAILAFCAEAIGRLAIELDAIDSECDDDYDQGGEL